MANASYNVFLKPEYYNERGSEGPVMQMNWNYYSSSMTLSEWLTNVVGSSQSHKYRHLAVLIPPSTSGKIYINLEQRF